VRQCRSAAVTSEPVTVRDCEMSIRFSKTRQREREPNGTSPRVRDAPKPCRAARRRGEAAQLLTSCHSVGEMCRRKQKAPHVRRCAAKRRRLEPSVGRTRSRAVVVRSLSSSVASLRLGRAGWRRLASAVRESQRRFASRRRDVRRCARWRDTTESEERARTETRKHAAAAARRCVLW
jgi:hypothetical protein